MESTDTKLAKVIQLALAVARGQASVAEAEALAERVLQLDTELRNGAALPAPWAGGPAVLALRGRISVEAHERCFCCGRDEGTHGDLCTACEDGCDPDQCRRDGSGVES